MSDAESPESEGVVERLRTVTPFNRGRPDSEMNTIGWALFIGLVILLIPLLPILLIVWAITKVLDAVSPTE